MRPRLTYANVASTLALVVALGGGGAAVAAGLAKDSVGSPQIRDGSIKNRDLGKDVIGTGRVLDGSLLGADLADETLTGEQVEDGSLTAMDILFGSLTGDQIEDGSIGSDDLADGSVGSGQLADGSVGSDQLADGSVTGAHVANDSLTGDDIDESTLDLDISGGSSGMLVASAASGQTQFAAGPNQMASVVLDAPSAGVALVTFQAELNAAAGSSYISVTPTRNGAGIGFYDWDAGDVDGFFDQRQTSFAIAQVPAAGQHTFAFAATEERSSGAYSRYYGAQIAVQFYPTASSARAALAGAKVPANR